MPTDLHNQLAEDAFSACRADFAREQGRSMSDDEQSVSRKAAHLAVEWAATQPVEHFLPTVEGKSGERRQRRLRRREERERERECRRYIEAHWDEVEGFGFVIALISAVIWHLIVVLIVRAIIKRFFESPSTAAEVCKG